jgi:hypothetical protein
MVSIKRAFALVCCLFPVLAQAQKTYRLRPAQVFDGELMHKGWDVIVQGNKIVAAGAAGGLKTVVH